MCPSAFLLLDIASKTIPGIGRFPKITPRISLIRWLETIPMWIAQDVSQVYLFVCLFVPFTKNILGATCMRNIRGKRTQPMQMELEPKFLLFRPPAADIDRPYSLIDR
jgi:hypothetical protein